MPFHSKLSPQGPLHGSDQSATVRGSLVTQKMPATFEIFEFEKDPFTLKSTKYLIELFPNARFILMTRDGRATAHSIISRQVTISGFDITSYRDVITKVCFRDPRGRCDLVRDFRSRPSQFWSVVL